MEQVLTDTLGNTVTLSYDANTDVVSIKNSGIDDSFHVITRNNQFDPESVIAIEGVDGENSWENYTDSDTRQEIRIFWEINKINKD